jgi:glycosyltransferase involved in cell wall biosynthesis
VGPLPPPIGGVETVTQAILESGAFHDFQLTHCDTTKGRPKQTQGRFDLGNLSWAFRHFARMRAAVARSRADVVYLPIAGTWAGFLRDMVLAYIAKRTGARLVGHVHGSDFHFVLERKGLSAGLVRAGLGQFDRLLVLGERWRMLVENFGVRAPCAIVPSTFRREVFERGTSFERPAPNPRAGRRAVEGLFVGQVGRRKGVFDLLAAMKRCKDMELPFRLTLVGPAELEGEWEALMSARATLGVEGVTDFTGPLQGEALYDRFKIGEVFVMPSYTEGLPVVFYEAGAFEMPVITTPVGAIPDLIVDGRNGLLVEPGGVEAIVQAIVRLVRHPDERAAMGRQLRQDIAAFHPDHVCARIAAEVRRTLEGA